MLLIAEHDAIYKWGQWWDTLDLCEEAGRWRGEGAKGGHVQTDTPLQFMWQFYVIFLTCCKESHSCHFDWPIKHSNLWSWSCQSSYDFSLLMVTTSPHLRNKSFMLDEMLQQNASKFTIFLEYQNPSSFFFPYYFNFFPNECPGWLGHSFWKKLK